jgi:flagellar biogenesis protein FliO
MYTTGAALAVVLGVFLLFAALVRKGAKKSNSLLPEEVVSVLGRVPLATRQFAELVRVGNKIVLISVTPGGAEPLTEITDPAEIDRLVGLCRSRTKGSSTDEFDQIFRKLADESVPSGFLGQEVPRVDARLAAPADVFAAYRGGASRA